MPSYENFTIRSMITMILLEDIMIEELFGKHGGRHGGATVKELIEPNNTLTGFDGGQIWQNSENLPGKSLQGMPAGTHGDPYVGIQTALRALHSALVGPAGAPPPSTDFSLGEFCWTSMTGWDSTGGPTPVKTAMENLAKAGVMLPPVQVRRPNVAYTTDPETQRICMTLGKKFKTTTFEDLYASSPDSTGSRIILRARKKRILRLV